MYISHIGSEELNNSLIFINFLRCANHLLDFYRTSLACLFSLYNGYWLSFLILFSHNSSRYDR